MGTYRTMRIQNRSGYNVSAMRKMTKSAPPQRTNTARNNYGPGQGRHASAAHALKTKSSANIFALSIEDIYQSAERERLNYSSACRRQNLAHAQSQTHFFRHDGGSPISRPNTSASRHINAIRRESNTPISSWSEPVVSRPNSIVPHPELRHLVENNENSEADDEDDNDEDLDMAHHTPMTVSFSPVSRGDCCEILGPQLCYECRKNRIRQVSRERSDMFFPTLEPSEENLTTAAIVRKYLPRLSDQEVEDKLARGEIARPSLKKQYNHPELFDEEEDARPKIIHKRVTIADTERDKKGKIASKKPNELFFTNIRDLNNKIITGNVDRNVGFSSVVRRVIKKDKPMSMKNHFPTFVSPRKVTMVQETNYKTYFEPPLIAKAKQDVEPQFFAGSSGEYTLPDKLPDELVFVNKDGGETKASSSVGFTAKLSASSEKTDKGTSSKPIVNKQEIQMVERDTELEILKEDIEEDEEETEEVDEVVEMLSTGETGSSVNSYEEHTHTNRVVDRDDEHMIISAKATDSTEENVTNPQTVEDACTQKVTELESESSMSTINL